MDAKWSGTTTFVSVAEARRVPPRVINPAQPVATAPSSGVQAALIRGWIGRLLVVDRIPPWTAHDEDGTGDVARCPRAGPSDLRGAIAAQRPECTPIASSRPSTWTTQRVPIQPAANRRRRTVTESGSGCLLRANARRWVRRILNPPRRSFKQ